MSKKSPISEILSPLNTNAEIRRRKIGDIGDNSSPVCTVLSSEPEYEVYVTESGKTCFDATTSIMNSKKQHISLFDEINAKIFHLLPKHQQAYAGLQAGYALTAAFVYENPKDGTRALKLVEQYVNDKLNENGRITYAISSFLIIPLIAVTCVFIPNLLEFLPHFEPITSFGHLGYGLLGSVGALLSVLTRLKDISTEGFYSKRYVVLQAFTRLFLGFVFGQFAYLLITGNVMFGFLSNSKNGLLIASIIAGFNERLIPETLKVSDK